MLTLETIAISIGADSGGVFTNSC